MQFFAFTKGYLGIFWSKIFKSPISLNFDIFRFLGTDNESEVYFEILVNLIRDLKRTRGLLYSLQRWQCACVSVVANARVYMRDST